MIRKKIEHSFKKVNRFYYEKPLLFLIILLVVIFIWDLILLPFTKKSKIITIQYKNSSNMVGRFRSLTMNYVIADENGDNYTYDYNGLLQKLNIQKTRYYEYFNFKEGDKVKVTYYGLFSRSILEIEKV